MEAPSSPPAERLWSLIPRLRRGIDPEATWDEFRRCLADHQDELLATLDTRRLVSVCDTFADFGDPIERRNAMLVSVLTNMEKVAQSFLLWRLGYDPAAFETADCPPPRKVRLWDGMDSFHVVIGDVTNNMFARLHPLLDETPLIAAIFREILARLDRHPTILGTLNRSHGHVFEPHTRWRKAPQYDHYRTTGEIPAWKTDD